jgi:tetratricopeptide (TPR) repeat protein
MSEKRKDFPIALEVYSQCLTECGASISSENEFAADETPDGTPLNSSSGAVQKVTDRPITFMRELRGEIMLRIAILRKETGAYDLAMSVCNIVAGETFGDSIRANALCLKGLLHEMRSEFPASEVVYRSALQIMTGHSTALERLGRVYLRYRETIPAAVQCFFKSVETNPSNHVAWYLLGRCYMATAQYSDACEAYNRAVNLNPNDPQVWCSLGVLYYAFGQYREALGMLSRALKLDPTMSDAWYNVGALYDMCDQPDDAQQAYSKARENGLADRFARAGMGLNPLAMQSLQYGTSDVSNVANSSQRNDEQVVEIQR